VQYGGLKAFLQEFSIVLNCCGFIKAADILAWSTGADSAGSSIFRHPSSFGLFLQEVRFTNMHHVII
jgi:hypothetical protein